MGHVESVDVRTGQRRLSGLGRLGPVISLVETGQ